MTAKLIQAADVVPQDRVLVVGSATGYSAAVASRLAAAVVALEEDSGARGDGAGRFCAVSAVADG